MITEAKRRAIAKYNKIAKTQIAFHANKNTDADILDFLDTLSNKQGYLKALIRADIANGSPVGQKFLKEE